jgi:hypothetical protein
MLVVFKDSGTGIDPDAIRLFNAVFITSLADMGMACRFALRLSRLTPDAYRLPTIKIAEVSQFILVATVRPYRECIRCCKGGSGTNAMEATIVATGSRSA